MKKWIGLSIAVVVLLGSYYGMGVATEKALKKNIDVLNQSNGAVVTVQHYQRGWFRSHAELQWTIKIPQNCASYGDGPAQGLSPPHSYRDLPWPYCVRGFRVTVGIGLREC